MIKWTFRKVHGWTRRGIAPTNPKLKHQAFLFTRKNNALFNRPQLRKEFINAVLRGGEYAGQMLTSSPILALAAYHPRMHPVGDTELKGRLVQGIRGGMKLKDLHTMAGIPYAYRKIEGREARKLLPLVHRMPADIVNNYAPSDPTRFRQWLKLCQTECYLSDEQWRPLNEWAMKKAAEVIMQPDHGRFRQPIDAVSHWAEASLRKHWRLTGEHEIYYTRLGREREAAVTRIWNEKMSLKAAQEETELWHDALAFLRPGSGPDVLPVPWFPVFKGEGFRFIPLRGKTDVMAEGREMRHCIVSYLDKINYGACVVYSLRGADNGRLLTVEVVKRAPLYARINAAHGYRNREPTKVEDKMLNEFREYLNKTPTFL